MKKILWNEYTWYSKLGAVILFVGIVPALSFYIGTQYAETARVLSSEDSVSRLGTLTKRNFYEGWKTYENTKYGFSLKYPETLSTSDVKKFHLLGTEWRVGAPTSNKGLAVVSVPVFRVENDSKYPRYFGAELRIGVSKDPKDVATCLSPSSGEATSTVTALIGGETWTVYPIADAAMMQYMQGTSYRTVHYNACFVMEELEVGSNYRDTTDPSDVTENILHQYFDQVHHIAQTFEFAE